MISDKSAPATSRDGGATKPKNSNRTVLPWIGWEWSRPHTWQWRTSLFGIRAGWWKAGRDQKSPIRRCF